MKKIFIASVLAGACVLALIHLHGSSTSSLISNGIQKPASGSADSWQQWENSYFQPLGGAGVKLTDADRLKYQMGKIRMQKVHKDPVKAKKASSWQSWENLMFGHSRTAVAKHLLPPRHPKNAALRRKHKSIVSKIADNSWVSKAEVDNVDTHKVTRFTDTIS